MSPTTAERPEKAVPLPSRPAAKAAWQVVQIGVELIGPSPYQPRLSFDPTEMEELAASVKERGVQQPVLVRTAKSGPEVDEKKGNGKTASSGAKRPRYELIAGERRLRACREAGRKQIPAIVRDDLCDRECAELALLENVQRSNLSVIEEARGYRQLMLKFGMKEERIARKVGKSAQTVQATLKLLQLPESVQELLAHKKLSASHGQELLPLAPFEPVCLAVARHAADNRVTAASLGANPLPNALELKRKGLLEELDWRTKFDWKEVCQACPHKALVRSGYASYCLRPDEWKRKQDEAAARHKDEAARALEQVRSQVREQVEAREQEGRVDVSVLPSGSYRNLAYVQVPAGCDGRCPCRREAASPHGSDARVPVCVDPARLKELQEAERQAHEDARRRHFTALWEKACQALQEEKGEPRKAAALITGTVLANELYRFGYDSEVGAVARSVARSLELELPWDELLGAEDDARMLPWLCGAASGQAAPTPDPAKLLLFAASLLLVQEGRGAVRFGGETPRLAFVLGPDFQAQLELPADGPAPPGPAPSQDPEPEDELPPQQEREEGPEADPFHDDFPDDLDWDDYAQDGDEERPEDDLGL